MGENNFATWPVVLYGLVMICAGIAYTILELSLIKHEGKHSTLAVALGKDVKGKISISLYAVAIPLAFVRAWLACAIYVAVVVIWLVPDRRIERLLQHSEHD
jgi:TMEM175 potassium channel family protein